MKAILLFIVMLITLQVNAQVNNLGYHRYDGSYARPDYRAYSDGYSYDSWCCNENSITTSRSISSRYSDDYYRRSNPVRSTIQSSYTQPSRSYSTYHDYYPPYSNITESANRNYYDSRYSTYFVAARSLNVRSGPSSGYDLIGELYYGENVSVVESCANGWKKIQYTCYDMNTNSFITKLGYVSGSYLSTAKPHERYSDTRNNYNTYNSNVYSSIHKAQSHYGIGGLTIWTNCGSDGGIKVYLDDVYVGTLTQYFTNGVPKCGESGTLFIEKPAGRYKLVAKGEHNVWSGTVIITKNKCLIQGLEK